MPEEKEEIMPSPPPEQFFFGRNPEKITPKFNRVMMRLLNRYRKRQLYEVHRIFDWDRLERQKPDLHRNHPDDDAKIAEAKRNLGDYKLKINADYEPKTSETLTAKYIEIVECREKYFHMVDDFNQEVMILRDKKKELLELIERKRQRVKLIHGYLPEIDRQFIRNINEVNMQEEYPELNLIEHYKPGCGVNIDDIITLENTVEDLLLAMQPKPMSESLNLLCLSSEQKEEIKEWTMFTALEIFKVTCALPKAKMIEYIKSLPNPSEAIYYDVDEEGNSPIINEIRHRWLRKLIMEQAFILASADDEINSFDQKLKDLYVKRFYTKLESEFLSAYMISLNQELYIQRDSEEIESQLQRNAKHAMGVRNELQVVINATNRQLDDLKKNIDKITEQIAALQVFYANTIKGHKFFDFLRRIFKKKYRPPKIPHGEDEESSSSESSSSSSEDEGADAGSVDSLDMTTIRLDETTCPIGLDRVLYEWAFTMRSERHAMERALVESNQDVNRKRREIAEMQSKMKYHNEVYQREKDKLMDFRVGCYYF